MTPKEVAKTLLKNKVNPSFIRSFTLYKDSMIPDYVKEDKIIKLP